MINRVWFYFIQIMCNSVHSSEYSIEICNWIELAGSREENVGRTFNIDNSKMESKKL